MDSDEEMPLSNKYRLKKSAEFRPCFICGKTSECVFDSEDDFFFVCLNHTKDTGFCTPVLVEVKPAVKPDDEVTKLKAEIETLKSQLSAKDSKTETSSEKPSEKTAEKTADRKDKEPVKVEEPKREISHYQLHKSILYLREKQQEERKRVSLINKMLK